MCEFVVESAFPQPFVLCPSDLLVVRRLAGSFGVDPLAAKRESYIALDIVLLVLPRRCERCCLPRSHRCCHGHYYPLSREAAGVAAEVTVAAVESPIAITPRSRRVEVRYRCQLLPSPRQRESYH